MQFYFIDLVFVKIPFLSFLFLKTNTMESVYVLKLEKSKWYIGKTDDIIKCYQQHVERLVCEWTSLYSPISLVELRPLTSDDDVNNLIKHYMKMYGIEHVRGDLYANVLDESTLTALNVEILEAEHTEQSPAERYYQQQLNRMKTYYEKNKESIAQKRREIRLLQNPEIQGRGKFNPKRTFN